MTQSEFQENVMKTIQNFLSPLFPENIDLHVISEEYILDKELIYAIFISFIGDVEGVLLLRTNDDTVQKFTNNLAIPVSTADTDKEELVKGYFGELANILMGKILHKIKDKTDKVDVTTPSLISGMAMSFQIPFKNKCSSGFSTRFGDFHLIVYYKRNSDQ